MVENTHSQDLQKFEEIIKENIAEFSRDQGVKTMVENSGFHEWKKKEDSIKQNQSEIPDQFGELKREMIDLKSRLAEIGSRLQQAIDGEDKAGESISYDGVIQAKGDFTPTYTCIDFPRFNGSEPKEWLCRCNRFFRSNDIEAERKVDLASIHLEGEAIHWFEFYQTMKITSGWEEFGKDVMIRFGNDPSANALGKLIKLRQQNSVENYREDFEGLVNLIKGFDEQVFISCFINGLKEELQNAVRLCNTISMKEAIEMAKFQEKNVVVQLCSVEAIHQTPGEHKELQPILNEIVIPDSLPTLRSKEQPIKFQEDSNATPQSLLTNAQARSQEYSVMEGAKQGVGVEIIGVVLLKSKLEEKYSNTMGPKCNGEQLKNSDVHLDIQWQLASGLTLWNFNEHKRKISLFGWKVVLQGDKVDVTLHINFELAPRFNGLAAWEGWIAMEVQFQIVILEDKNLKGNGMLGIRRRVEKLQRGRGVENHRSSDVVMPANKKCSFGQAGLVGPLSLRSLATSFQAQSINQNVVVWELVSISLNFVSVGLLLCFLFLLNFLL